MRTQSKFGLVLLLVSSLIDSVGFSWSFSASLGPNADRNATLEPMSAGLMTFAFLLQIVVAGLFQSAPARPLRFIAAALGCVAASFFAESRFPLSFPIRYSDLAQVLTRS